jgi:hypothetical protein
VMPDYHITATVDRVEVVRAEQFTPVAVNRRIAVNAPRTNGRTSSEPAATHS